MRFSIVWNENLQQQSVERSRHRLEKRYQLKGDMLPLRLTVQIKLLSAGIFGTVESLILQKSSAKKIAVDATDGVSEL